MIFLSVDHLKIRDQNHKLNIIRNQNYNLTFIKLIDITQVCNMAICNDKISHSSTPYGIWKHLKQIVRKHGDNYLLVHSQCCLVGLKYLRKYNIFLACEKNLELATQRPQCHDDRCFKRQLLDSWYSKYSWRTKQMCTRIHLQSLSFKEHDDENQPCKYVM